MPGLSFLQELGLSVVITRKILSHGIAMAVDRHEFWGITTEI